MNKSIKWPDDKPIAREDFEPFKIVSLWDMYDLDAAAFVNTCLALGGVTGLLTGLRQNPDCSIQIGDGGYELLNLAKLKETLADLGLPLSAIAADRLLVFLEGEKERKAEELETRVLDLTSRFRDELMSRHLMMIPYQRVKYYMKPWEVFSEASWFCFPSTQFDMTEAAKCFALDRHTACVFHAMRVLEPGLRALGNALGLTVQENWNTALDRIEKEIRNRNTKTHGPQWKTTDEPFFTGAAVHFRMVKNAWRNHTMHLKQHYDEPQAKAILNSVGDFMRHLATRLHEQTGDPS